MNPNLQAFLWVIRFCEGTAGTDGYRTMFGGGTFDSYADHPRKRFPFGNTYSTAAGAYQFLASTWDECAKALSLPDFSPASQDLAAVYLIKRRGALEDVEAGRIATALADCNKEWASLPGAPYGQPTRSLEYCLKVYADHGGALARMDGPVTQPNTGTPIQKEGSRMDPFTIAAIPRILQMVPSLLGVLGGDKAERNAKAAQVVADAFTAAVPGATNVQDAIQKAEASPMVKASAAAAVEANPAVLALVEVGGGVAAARKFSDDYMARVEDDEWWRMLLKIPANPAMLISAAMFYLVAQFVTPLAVMVPTLSNEVRAAIIVSIIAGLGTVLAFWFGTTQARKRDDE